MKPEEVTPSPAEEEYSREKPGVLIIFIQYLLQPPILIVFLSVLTYLCGLACYEGIMLQWGLNASSFPLSVDKVMAYAFLPTIILTTRLVWIFVGITAIGAVLYWILKKLGKIGEKVKVERVEKVRGPLTSEVVAFSITYSLILLICSSALVLYYHHLGKGFAQNNKAIFDRGEGIEVAITLRNKPEPLKGNTILCSEQQCAFYIKGEVVVLPLSDIREIVSKPRTE